MGIDVSGVGGIWLIRGCIDCGRSGDSANSALIAAPAECCWGPSPPASEPDSVDIDRKYSDLPCTMRGLSVVNGGRRLILLPALALSSSCLASSRLCRAKASRGESSGGCSPATCRRGDLSGRGMEEACDSERMSMKLGLVGVDIVNCSSHRTWYSWKGCERVAFGSGGTRKRYDVAGMMPSC